MDDGVSSVTVTGNICYHAGEWAIQIHGGANNTFQNNIFDLSSAGTELGLYQSSGIAPTGMTGNVFQRNIVYSATTFTSTLWTDSHGANAALTDTTNMYFSANGSAIPNTTIVDPNRQLANPLMTNPAVGDYTLSPSSPAYTSLSWTTLPTDAGPLPNPY